MEQTAYTSDARCGRSAGKGKSTGQGLACQAEPNTTQTRSKRLMRLRLAGRRFSADGLTLLEVLVALAILSIVLSITYATFSATTGHIGAARRSSDAFQTARIIMERVCMDLSSAVVCKTDCKDALEKKVVRPFVCSGRVGEKQSFSSLSFSSTSHLALTGETEGLDLTRIEYRIEEEDGAMGLTLLRKDDPFPGTFRDDENRFMVVGERLGRMELVFFDSEGREHLSWDSTDASFEGVLPTRVELKFTVLDSDENEHSFTSGWTLPPSSS
ncbi:MAG: prepilin-type N-terminal cleavage/methylation domain-containing protein [Deltaproteobacteria bacterium]|nr:prepilin-type N-terminal cleavage/methylation domain-containing protein [Deltaproteobacteria bacterium]